MSCWHKKRWALLLTEKTCKRWFLSLFYCANSCLLQPGPAAWMGASRPGSKVQFISFSLLTPVNCCTVRSDSSACENRHISCCNQGTLSIILGVLITCIMPQMNKGCIPRIILLVSCGRMSLELLQMFLLALHSCHSSQRKCSNFISASGPQPMDTKIIKHSLSFLYSLCNWYSFPSLFSLNLFYWTQIVLYTENDCLSIKKTATTTLQSLFLWHSLLLSVFLFADSFRDSLPCSLLWVFLQLFFLSYHILLPPLRKKEKDSLDYFLHSVYSKLSMVLIQKRICLFGDLIEDLF